MYETIEKNICEVTKKVEQMWFITAELNNRDRELIKVRESELGNTINQLSDSEKVRRIISVEYLYDIKIDE